ncbi:MAG: class I SAM-dependent methyltransferase [Vicinamibacteraceae bacterium]
MYQPSLPIVSRERLDAIKHDHELRWYHNIRFEEFETPGLNNDVLWSRLAGVLQEHADLVSGKDVLEYGPADGLWSMWLTQLGARSLTATDYRDYTTYRHVVETFGLPVEYYPGLQATKAPRVIRRDFDLVVSFGVLYHMHDPLINLMMYHMYLRPNGVIFLETAAVQSTEHCLYYSPDGPILPARANNLFAPTTGVLDKIVGESLGCEIDHSEFIPRPHNGSADFGRYILVARKSHPARVSMYESVRRSLGFGVDSTPQSSRPR